LKSWRCQLWIWPSQIKYALLYLYNCIIILDHIWCTLQTGGHRGRDLMIVEFTTTYAINTITTNVMISNRVLDTTLCDKYFQWLVAGRWFSPGTPVSTNKTDRYDISEKLLKVALSTITIILTPYVIFGVHYLRQTVHKFKFCALIFY
jgi:hypothetical protein